MSYKKIMVQGIVQGVGFRPFIYKIAQVHSLNGYVVNTPSGVVIDVEGKEEAIARFISDIVNNKPPLAQIESVVAEPGDPAVSTEQFHGFVIRESITQGTRQTLVAPDRDVCGNCLAELTDPADRRYRYPFINCTDCGPRYTLIDGLPYDRPFTAMKDFQLCANCRSEYLDPGSRRFHAEIIACPVCGPQLSLVGKKSAVVAGDVITNAQNFLKNGSILAIKGIGGFHLAVDAANQEAVHRLRRTKGRPAKPLAVMAFDLTSAGLFAELTEAQRRWLTSRQKPIVLLNQKLPFPLAANVAPGNRYIGVMLPYTPLHHLLLDGNSFLALVMTSGNLSGEPIIRDNAEALMKLASIADYFLLHNRQIVTRNDDSVLFANPHGNITLLRRSRSFAPCPIRLATDVGHTLAVGANIKNTFCLTRGKDAFISQHIGNLDQLDSQDNLAKTIHHLSSILEFSPTLIVHDLHPDYSSTRLAQAQKNAPCIGVQHHFAHAVSCMAEHGLFGPVIALCLDGNGLGLDGTIWGGEVLIATLDGFKRQAHLAPVPMPGGEAAIRQPWRMAASHLYCTLGSNFLNLKLPFLSDHAETLPTIIRMMDQKVNTPLTSSCGRLFDAVAAILDICPQASYEGQAAAELESAINVTDQGLYPYVIEQKTGGPWQLQTGLMITELVGNFVTGAATGLVSRRFHNTIAAMFTEVCARIRADHQLSQVVLSGGCFQNMTLTAMLTEKLEADGFRVFAHQLVPPNDGGLALGQAVAGMRQHAKRYVNG